MGVDWKIEDVPSNKSGIKYFASQLIQFIMNGVCCFVNKCHEFTMYFIITFCKFLGLSIWDNIMHGALLPLTFLLRISEKWCHHLLCYIRDENHFHNINVNFSKQIQGTKHTPSKGICHRNNKPNISTWVYMLINDVGISQQ